MKQKSIQICISAVLLITALLIPSTLFWVRLSLFVAAYLTVGYGVLWEAVQGIFHLEVFDENFLMALATVGAFALGEYTEAVAVMLLYAIGEMFEQYAVRRSRRSIAALMDIRPDHATLLQADGTALCVAPQEVNVNDRIRVAPGEKIPLDGVVEDGRSDIDTAALTGESMPRSVNEGDTVLSGCINLSGVLTVRVTKPFGESTVSKVLELVENAACKKAKAETFITRFAAVYTPIVVIAAVILAIFPPLLFANQAFAEWLYRALTFLMVSCPCALVISVPLTFFGGIGGASKQGILFKGGNYVETLARVKTVVFDKTGTLTHGTFTVQDIQAVGVTKEELLYYAAHAECCSSHPIAHSLCEAYGKEIDRTVISDITEKAGYGVTAVVNGHTVLVGNAALMKTADIPTPDAALIGTTAFVAINGVYSGCIHVCDTLKADAKPTVSALKSARIRTVMLTGDTHLAGEAIATSLGVDTVYSELLPADKVAQVETLLKQRSDNGSLLFVGDGINDAPVLARADVGVAMGGSGSDAAIEAADVVLMTDEPRKLLTAISIARKTRRIVRQNVVFALTVKIGVLILSALGLVGMWAAVIADVGVSVVAVANALRMLKSK